MRTRVLAALSVVAVLSGLSGLFVSGCTSLRSDFECTSDLECASASGAAGRCEPVGRCSLPDVSCLSGARFIEYAGKLSNRCTSEPEIGACGAKTEVRAGPVSTCARSGDAVWCWGNDLATPKLLELPTGRIAELEVGGAGTCVRFTSGTVACRDGSVNGSFTGFSTSETPGLLAVGAQHACAVRGDGTVACWGQNEFGQLGDGPDTTSTPPPSTTPVAVVELAGVTQLAAGGRTSCAVNVNREVWCWGDNRQKQLGRGGVLDRAHRSPSPSRFLGGALLMDMTSVSVGDQFGCATNAAGDVYCWGSNEYWQLGDKAGSTEASPQLTLDHNNATRIERVSAGGSHACATDATGQLRCWGLDTDYQAGVTPSVSVGTPTLVDRAIAERQLSSIEGGGQHTCGIDPRGEVYCWGSGAHGQLGPSPAAPGEPPAAPLACRQAP